MLLSLSIRDLVLIDALHLNVGSGLTALTGETGAGKSVLLDALGLALGRRGDVSLIRQGKEQAVVTAEFCIKGNSAVTDLLKGHGLAEVTLENADTLVVRRILSRKGNSLEPKGDIAGENLPENAPATLSANPSAAFSGRSRAFINDQMVSIGLLRLLGDSLLEIHAQFDRLLDVSSYRLLLDEFAKSNGLRQKVEKTYGAWQQAYGQWQQAESDFKDLQQNEGLLTLHLKELKILNPLKGEEENLLQEREGLAHAGRLSEALREARRHLQTPSVETALHAALKSLQRVQVQGIVQGTIQQENQKINPPVNSLSGNPSFVEKTDAASAALARAQTEVVEAEAQIEDIFEQLANHPQRLQEIDERLYALRVAARKHGVGGNELAGFHEKLELQISSLGQAADLLQEYAQATARAKEIYYSAAKDLHSARQEAAQTLMKNVIEELPALKLPHAQFAVHITELPEKQWGENGLDRIDFMVAMNKGQELCSLSRSASGGEMARLMLALKVALASRSAIPTIIFDEIDTGVGGAVAAAIGERLAALAKDVQVLAITHSPQLAACAKDHFLVFKEDQGDFMRTCVKPLTATDRQDELARMLSGAEVTVEAQAAAKRLLGVQGL